MKALLIAEKPDLMRKVQVAYRNNNFDDIIDFESFHGHLLTLCDPQDYDKKYEKWNRDDLPIIPEEFKYKIVDRDSVSRIKNKIKEGDYDYLINCCDPDREGQHIFYSFYRTIKCKLPVKRMWHADLTEKEIMRALNSMEDDINTPRLANLTEASFLRADLDWLIGMNASRLITLKRGSLSRIGSVVTPTLRMIVDRELAIQNFKPETTYGIESDFNKGYTGELITINKDTKKEEPVRFKTKREAQDKIDLLGSAGKVVSVDKVQDKEYAPKLPSLADIQMQANKLYGYRLDETLQYIQELYEDELVSYPRTDCSYLTAEIAKDFKRILGGVEAGVSDPKLLEAIGNITSTDISRVQKDKKYVNDANVTAHYALIPTGTIANFGKLSMDHINIYNLICRRFVSIFMPPCLTDKTKVITEVDKDKFVTYGSIIKDLGYKALFAKDKDNEDLIPDLKKGESVEITVNNISEHTTTPPSRYNDASILQAMINAGNMIEDKELAEVLRGNKSVKDSGGIGTPATRSAIVNKLFEEIKLKDGTKYRMVERKGKSFVATKEGIDLINAIRNNQISSPELRAVWERKIREVADGKLSAKQFRLEMNEYTKEMVNELDRNEYVEVRGGDKMSETVLDGVICPICGGEVVETAKGYKCANYSKEDGCKFYMGKDFLKAKITDKEIRQICDGKKTKMLKMTSPKSGKSFTAALKFNSDTNKIEFDFDDSVGIKCPTCGKELVKFKSKDGAEYIKCNDGHFFTGTKVSGHKLSNKDLTTILSGKETAVYDDFISKAGKNFKASLYLEGGKIKMKFPEK